MYMFSGEIPIRPVGKASKPLREFITFVVDVLRFKNKSETLVVFLVISTTVIAMVIPMTPPPPSRCTCTVCGTDGSSNYCCLWPY